VFAGAAREAVFSREDVIAKVREQFVPVALKAAMMNNPPPGPEGRFLGEIRRTKLAPQGICVANSAGKVLAWALTFDDEKSVPAFLDHVVARYREFPDASKPVAAERFMRYPSNPHAPVDDSREKLPKIEAHGADAYCLATPPKAKGTVIARVWGRTVDENGKLSENCHQQDSYIEDVFDIPPSLSGALKQELDRVGVDGVKRVIVPRKLSETLVTYAYLGQLDVRPINSPVPGHTTDVRELELWAKPLERTDGAQLVELSGRSDVHCSRTEERRGPGGGDFVHDVTLEWHGFLSMKDGRIIDVVLWGEGRERLRWNASLGRKAEGDAESPATPGRTRARRRHARALRHPWQASSARAHMEGRGTAPGSRPPR
jgi:hypothetical protein